MINKMITLICLTSFIISCSLDRNNPVDPINTGTPAPSLVTGLFVQPVNDYWLSISWDSDPDNVDGYYLYRSMSYDGYYELLNVIDHDVSSYDDTDEIDTTNNIYWYKISAFVEIGDDNIRLEGVRSNPQSWGPY